MSLGLEEMGLQPAERVLVYGIGNVGRQDDGLGVRLVERLERAAPQAWEESARDARTTFEANYQLGIEDALLLSRFDVVLFLDASCERGSVAPWTVRRVVPSAEIAFTTHAMSFSSVLSICEELYHRRPRTFLVGIRGYGWDIAAELSPRARVNLDLAFEALSVVLQPGPRTQGERRADGARSPHA